ncbi:tripartite tricarboxylate transporter TctB family protein [Alcaligenaceae bacterium B3P038]|nr:tripartite tricarboxylate transporter TctB family protein [Alcaligenaceae bacterium B3P038]
MARDALLGLAQRRVRNQRDAVVGALYLAVGSAFAWYAADYERGTAARMGAGYFPFWLALILMGLGAIVLFRSTAPAAERVTLAAWDTRSLVWMTGAVVFFGLVIKPLGLVVAIAILVVAASLASPTFTWRGTLINAAVLCAINAVAFGLVLGLPLDLWPVWLL